MGSGLARDSRPQERRRRRRTPFKSLLFRRCGAHVQQDEQRRGAGAKPGAQVCPGRSSVSPESASWRKRALVLMAR